MKLFRKIFSFMWRINSLIATGKSIRKGTYMKRCYKRQVYKNVNKIMRKF